MFALQRVNGLPENNIPFHPPNATAKIKDTNEGGAKSVKLSSGEARAACGKRKQEFNTFRARAVSLSHHQKSKEKPTSMKYRVSKTKASYSQLCSHEGCAKAVVQGGVCVQHGAKVNRCGQEGCTNQAQKGGVCKRHGAKVKTYICSHEGCTSQVKKGGVCKRHGAKVKKYICSHEGCNNHAAKKGGVCVRHGAKRKNCSREGCTSQVKKGGLCYKHGAKKMA